MRKVSVLPALSGVSGQFGLKLSHNGNKISSGLNVYTDSQVSGSLLNGGSGAVANRGNQTSSEGCKDQTAKNFPFILFL